MKLCEGRVAIVTGSGARRRSAYALMLAQHGAKVVVNDLGAAAGWRGRDASPGNEVVSHDPRCGWRGGAQHRGRLGRAGRRRR